MRSTPSAVLFAALLAVPTSPAAAQKTSVASGASLAHLERVAVANRASGTVSLIDVATDRVIAERRISNRPTLPEPMYLVAVPGELWVGDRANSEVVVLDPATLDFQAAVPAGKGVFHMMVDPTDRWLWVVADEELTIRRIDVRARRADAVIQVPADLVAAGGRPHDVAVDHDHVYVALSGLAGPFDQVVAFDAESLQEVARRAVGKDPHLALVPSSRELVVPSQGADLVQFLDRGDLLPLGAVQAPGAHGVWLAPGGRTFYTTNLPGGGSNGLITIDVPRREIRAAIDTPFPVPHNIVATRDGRRLYVTHSGAAADQVSIYATGRGRSGLPELVGTLTVGLNPFGIARVR